MKKNLHLILNIILIVFVSIFQSLYIKQPNEIAFKAIASIGFVILGTLNLVYAIKNRNSNLKFCITMVVGLFFAMLGDILLEINFIIGAIFFAVGHVLFFVAYCFAEKFKWIDLIAGGVIAVASVLIITLLPIFNFGSTLKILCAVYAVIISFMLGKAATNFFRNRNLLNAIILIGSVLFFFSDLMLLLGNFAGLYMSSLCLGTYYPAEILLSVSLAFSYKQIQTNKI